MNDAINNLNGLRCGVDKHWPLKDKHDYSLLQDYWQKISFCIQDLNDVLSTDISLSMKDIIFIIIQAVWIEEALSCALKIYDENVIADFSYGREDEVKYRTRYLKALRSFIVAHPLTTNRHKAWGLDGDLICVDIRRYGTTFPLASPNDFYHFGIHELEHKHEVNDDFYLYVYSMKADGMKFFRYIGCSVNDIIDTVKLYVDKLYEFDKYLYKSKRSSYHNNGK